MQLTGQLVINKAGTLTLFALELGIAWRSMQSPEITKMEDIGWVAIDAFPEDSNYWHQWSSAIMPRFTLQAIEVMDIVFNAYQSNKFNDGTNRASGPNITW